MRIVITGASGNVGSALLRRLAGGGHDLVGVVRRPPAEPDGGGGGLGADVEWHAADLTTDASVPVLRSVTAGADAVVHLAWGFQPSHRLDLLEELGVGGTSRVLTAVAASGVPHLVHMSSVGAYSPKRDDEPVDESYPTGGIPGSPYSNHKSAAERLLDTFEQQHPDVVVTRTRPGIVGQGSAGSALLRYGLPAFVPAAAVTALPVLPLDEKLRVPMVHADDVADAIARALEGTVPGPFNLAAEPVLTADGIAAALGAKRVQVPAAVLRGAVNASWHARLQPLDPGWIDLAFRIPLMDTTRARAELGWSPAHSGSDTLAETVAGMAGAESDSTPVLRPRTVAGQLAAFLRGGPVTRRRTP